MKSDIKYCEDCVYHVEGDMDFGPHCSLPIAVADRCCSPPIRRVKIYFDKLHNCNTARSETGFCGPNGVKWKQKRAKAPYAWLILALAIAIIGAKNLEILLR